MRIGQFLAHYPFPGGTTTAVEGLSLGFTHLSHDVVIYGYSSEEAKAYDNRGLAIRLGPAPVWWRSRHDWLYRRLKANIDELDVLILNGIFGRYSRRLQRAALMANIPCVAWPHDPYLPVVFERGFWKKKLFWIAREKPFLQRCCAVHVLAPSHENPLASLGVTTSCFSTPNAIDFEGAPTSATKIHRRPEKSAGTIRLLYLGRLDIYNKGLDLLLHALAEDDALRDFFHLDLVGRGAHREQDSLRRMIHELRLTDHVRLIGEVEDPKPYLQAAHVTVLPSRFDGFGLVVLESLAIGKPAMVSTSAGASEYLGSEDGVLTVDPSTEGILSGLNVLRDSHLRLKKNAELRMDELSKRFSWPTVASEWIRAVLNLCQ